MIRFTLLQIPTRKGEQIMKKLVKTLITSALVLTLAVSLTACKKSGGLTIAVPNDTTNEARALLLLQEQGYITLKDGAGILSLIHI